MLLPLITTLLPVLGKVLDSVLPNKLARDAAKLELLKLASEQESAELKAASAAITTEARSEHWIVAAWRPITMLVFTSIIANNYILAPYFALMFDWNVTLELPPQMWDLLKIGLGGYVAGRSLEKAAKAWKGNGNT